MKRSFLPVFLTLLLAGGFATSQAQTLPTSQWREDLAFLWQSIRTHHPNPFHAVTEESLQSMVDALYARIPTLDSHEIIVEMARIVAMIQDGHTGIRGGLQFLTGQYPLRLHVFDDGIFVRSAPSALRGAVGARLLKLGDRTAEEAYTAVATITAHDNAMTLKNRVPDAMVLPEILHALEITPDRDQARFVLADRQGRELTVDLTPLPFDATLNWIDAAEGDTEPLYRRRVADNYWHQYLEESQTLYVQYNRVRDASDETIAQYFDRVSQFARDLPIQRIVLDVRGNGGGNDYLNAPVVEWVKSSPSVTRGRFYVIIGRGTYSAAQKLVTRLDATTGVVFVGEPTGGSPNHFGDAVRLRLPNSDLTLTVSSVYHGDAPGDGRRSIEPDLWAPPSSEDYFAGRDAAMEAILSTEQPGSPTRR